ncbi:hypothetical protein TKK_0014576 [Trichogramma kaykai]
MSGRAVNSGSDSASSGNRAANRPYEKPDVAGGMRDGAHATISVPIRDRVALVRPFTVNNARPGPGVSVNANANVNVSVGANANANVNVNTNGRANTVGGRAPNTLTLNIRGEPLMVGIHFTCI